MDRGTTAETSPAPERTAALAAVMPIRWDPGVPQVMKLPSILGALKFAMQPRADIPQPECAVRVLDVPLPLPALGPIPTFAAQPHHVFGDLPP